MDWIDLHTHSYYSDGTLSPKALLELARQQGLRAISITDHDTLAAYPQAFSFAKQVGVELICGIEFAAMDSTIQQEIHLLGYFLDYTTKSLQEALHTITADRKSRNQKMIKKLNDMKIAVSYEALEALAGGKDSVITRAHFARLLLQEGYVNSTAEAFETYIGSHCPAYIPRTYLTAEQCITLIKEAKGKAVLAHPGIYRLDKRKIKSLLNNLSQHGLDGVEAFYSSHSLQDELYFRSIAKELSLSMTGGSDFHGSNKPDISLGLGFGSLRVPYLLLEQLRNRK